jgi:Arc/MetJ-type ribon-helix-helix transcriptional regulator
MARRFGVLWSGAIVTGTSISATVKEEGVTTMEVQLTPDQEALIRQAVQNGRYVREEDALLEAVSLWERQERRREEILAAVDQAEASHARGEGRSVSSQQEAAQLAERIKLRGLARLASLEEAR